MYVGIGPEKGIKVFEENAFDYAMEHMKNIDEESKKQFVEWFFSGDFIKEDEACRI